LPVGQRLKALRTKRKITIREVEKASRRIAEAKRDKRFFISNGWLAQLEKGVSEPSICKLFSLSVIYHVKFFDLIQLYDVDIDEIERYEPVASPHATQLLPVETMSVDSAGGRQTSPFSSLRLHRTGLLPNEELLDARTLTWDRDRDGATALNGYIGLNDFTMYPLIRPGSLVRIDTREQKPRTVVWHNEYERPIYFLELRDAYACGWCELQGTELLLIPHHSSPETIRRFAYPKDAEIVGRVIGFDTRWVEEARDLDSKEFKRVRARSNSG
jgi:transcriptional regulator with XRE-family HTH domain